MQRSANCLAKLDRMNKALRHQEPDRVPVSGSIFQSDHSVPSNVPPASYDFVVRLVRERGRYPLDLGPCDLPDVS